MPLARAPAGPALGLAAALAALVACAGMLPGRDASPLSGVRLLEGAGRRSGEGYFDPSGARLVFQSEREPGNPFFQIYLRDLAGGETRRVSTGRGKTTCAFFHPDGARVLFASTHADPGAAQAAARELARRAAETAGARRYAWDFDPHYDLYVRDLATGTLEPLSPAPGYDAEAAFSPDGTHVVFASNRHAHAPDAAPEERALLEPDPGAAVDLYRMRADGSELRRLTRSAGYDGGPFFSPDGSRIVWRRFAADGSGAEIHSMAADGGDVRQLTGLGGTSWAPFYHPSGRYLIFASDVSGHRNFELFLVDVEGRREPLRVTESAGFDGLPVFSPDGARLAWTRRPPGAAGSRIFQGRWDHARALALLAARPERADELDHPAVTARELRTHVEALASERMGGRLTGTDGERLATRYVADVFARLGLEPAGDAGSWFQPFEFTAGISLGSANRLRIALADPAEPGRERSESYAVEWAWRPLAFSRSGEGGPAPVVFAGYGISAPAGDQDEAGPAYDSYGDLDVDGKWVLVLRFLPEDVAAPRRQHLHRYASLRHKAMIARDRGALGLLVASGPGSQVREPLVALRRDVSSGATSLLALSVRDSVAEALLAPGGHSLAALQAELDRGELAPGFELAGVRLDARIDVVQEQREGRNVLGRLASGGDGAPLLVGAHVDHLGRALESGASLARAEEAGEIHYGADDNASGVAALLEIAGALAARARDEPGSLRRDVLFAAWSGEEVGLLGSAAFARRLRDVHALAHGAPRELAAYLNLDMVGRLRERLVLQGVGSSPLWPELVARAGPPGGVPVVLQEESYLPTDATSFYLRGIPVLSAFTGAHDAYHTPRDRPETLNYAGLEAVAQLFTELAAALAARDTAPAFAAGPRPEAPGPRAGLRAYLGTIPSYGEPEGRGLLLAGVAAGGPAERAGLRAGDRIVALAGRAVENIYDYTYAIDALALGQPVEIVVVREGRRLVLALTPVSRE